MTALPFIDVIGAWVGIFLTFCILSFLYKDNPFYKFAEHLFVGVSIGYVITLQYEDTIRPALLDHLPEDWWKIFPLILVALMLVKAVSRRWAWLGRFPLAFVVALYAGLAINAVAQSELGAQIKFASRSLDAQKVDLNHATAPELGKVPGVTPAIAQKLVDERTRKPFESVEDAVTRPGLTAIERDTLADERGSLVGIDAKAAAGAGERDWFGIVSNVLLLAGLLSSLLYFYFSLAHKGVVGRVSRFGVWVLMIGFGASFGFTVQGRIALAIGRALDVEGKTIAPDDAAAIHGPWAALVSIVVIVAGIAVWELRARRHQTSGGAAGVQQSSAVYELIIGWRYIYNGQFDRTMLACAVCSLLAVVAGAGVAFMSDGSSPIGVVLLIIGMLSTAVFSLLTWLSVFTSVSVLGVVLGVASLTFSLSMTTGFQQQFREKVLGVNAHVIIMKNSNDFDEYRHVMDVAQNVDPDVIATQPFIFTEMLVTRGRGELSGVAIKGVDPDRVTKVLDLEKHMTEGTVAALNDDVPAASAPPIIMGRELAKKLKAHVGDDVTLVVAFSDNGVFRTDSSVPKTRKFKVVGIFYSGFDEYDSRLMYVTLKQAQKLVGHGDRVMGVELKIKDVTRARDIADKLSKQLGEPPYVIQDWYELNHNLFKALTLQKLALMIILLIIIAVASFNMVSALTMMVTDKTREIAILKSMGATSSSVAKLFQVVGLAIGGVGTVLGLLVGLVACWTVDAYGYQLDSKVYLIDRLPITVRPTEILMVAGITMAICGIATLVPSAKASSLTPVDGLRYD